MYWHNQYIWQLEYTISFLQVPVSFQLVFFPCIFVRHNECMASTTLEFYMQLIAREGTLFKM